MKNLQPSNRNSFDVHVEILSSRKQDIVVRLSLLNKTIKAQYQLYEDNFAQNTLESLMALPIDTDSKKDLMKLYDLKNKVIQQIKSDITTVGSQRITSTCQNCTINSSNTLDHYLPKTSFSEFVVNPKNLFPCCSECNSYKSNIWLIDNKRPFLNLYLDILPEEQYLFADIKDGGLEITFSLRNDNVIEPKLFEIIESHYRRLHLLERFRAASSDIVVELAASLGSIKNSFSENELVSLVIESESKTMIAHGSNYWKSILKIALVQNTEFFSKYV